MKMYFMAITLIFLLAGCQNYPKDPEDTLKKISNDTLRVGCSENSPWVIETDQGISGIEATLVKAFGAQHHAAVKWIKDTENELFQDLIDRKLHVVITGLTTESPWKKEKIGITRTYLKKVGQDHIMAVPQGENAFLISLEKFLINKEKEIKELLKSHETNEPF